MAYFHAYDIAAGWWFYFEMKYAMGSPEYRLEFQEELSNLISKEGNEDIEQDDSKQKRIPLRKMRGKVY